MYFILVSVCISIVHNYCYHFSKFKIVVTSFPNQNQNPDLDPDPDPDPDRDPEMPTNTNLSVFIRILHSKCAVRIFSFEYECSASL